MSFSLWHHLLYFTEDIIMLLWHHLLWFIEDIIMYFDSVKVIQWNHNDLLILICSYQYIWTLLWNFKLCVHLYTGNDINNSWVIIMRALTDMYLIRTKFMFVYFLAKLLILIDNVKVFLKVLNCSVFEHWLTLNWNRKELKIIFALLKWRETNRLFPGIVIESESFLPEGIKLLFWVIYVDIQYI